jgi:hypothetical protein
MGVEVSRDRSSTDRRRRTRPVKAERRSGFDRRLPASRRPSDQWVRILQTYRDNPRAILLTLAVFTTLNLADLLLTLQNLSLGAREANPAMKALFDVNPMWAGVVKMGVGMVAAEIIWTWRRHRAALALSIGITVAMAGILGWHLFVSQQLPL